MLINLLDRHFALALVLATASCFTTDRQFPIATGENSDRSQTAIKEAAKATTAVKRDSAEILEISDEIQASDAVELSEEVGAHIATETPKYSPPRLAKIETPAPPPNVEQDTLNYDIEWNGPLEPLLSALAKSRLAALEIRGTAPAQPLKVALYVYETGIADVIRALDNQIEGSGKIEPLPFENGILLDYGE